MRTIDLIMMAMGVSMDAAAVATCKGMGMGGQFSWRLALRMAMYFGLFQGIMPIVGFSLGSGFHEWIQHWDHWIAFVLLSWVGIGMMRQSREQKEARDTNLSHMVLFALAVATSIDALAVGISLAFLHANILLASSFMAGVTFFVSLFAARTGHRLQTCVTGKAEVLGGVVLLLLGMKILIEKLMI